jgi:SAM-dependent methyltransferase
MVEDLPEHVRRNRAAWDEWAPDWMEAGRRNWADPEISWGAWGVPEAELHVLPDVAGRDVIELGCGTAYIGSWLARRGARVVGIDNSERQLATARELQREFGLSFPLVHGNAESVPLPDASFDLAVSEYGASIWADPERWVPEAARLLRPGGCLVFLVNGVIFMLCSPDESDVPAGDRLLRPYFGMSRFEWPDDDSVEFHLARRLDPAAPASRIRGRESRRDPGAGGRDNAMEGSHARMGTAVAERGDLGRPAPLSRPRDRGTDPAAVR